MPIYVSPVLANDTFGTNMTSRSWRCCTGRCCIFVLGTLAYRLDSTRTPSPPYFALLAAPTNISISQVFNSSSQTKFWGFVTAIILFNGTWQEGSGRTPSAMTTERYICI